MRPWPNSLMTPGNHVLYPYRHLLSSSYIFEIDSYFVLQTSLELTIYTRLAQTCGDPHASASRFWDIRHVPRFKLLNFCFYSFPRCCSHCIMKPSTQGETVSVGLGIQQLMRQQNNVNGFEYSMTFHPIVFITCFLRSNIGNSVMDEGYHVVCYLTLSHPQSFPKCDMAFLPWGTDSGMPCVSTPLSLESWA